MKSISKNCFVSAPFGANTRTLARELEKRNYRVRDARSLPMSESALDSLRVAITTADLVCAVLPAVPLPAAYLEIGLAFGLSKEIAVFAQIGTEVPGDLAGLTYCRAALDDGDEIGRFLDLFLKHHPGKPKALGARGRLSVPKLTKPIASQARSTLAATNGPAVERLFRDLFSGLGYVVSEPYVDSKESVDFAVWIDSLQAAIGNPIPVEVKANVSSLEALDTAEHQLRRHLERVGNKLGVLIYTSRVAELVVPAASSRWPVVLRVSGAQTIDWLEAGSFETHILQLRNSVAHGLPFS